MGKSLSIHLVCILSDIGALHMVILNIEHKVLMGFIKQYLLYKTPWPCLILVHSDSDI